MKTQMGMIHSIITETKLNCQNNKRSFCSSPGTIWEKKQKETTDKQIIK